MSDAFEGNGQSAAAEPGQAGQVEPTQTLMGSTAPEGGDPAAGSSAQAQEGQPSQSGSAEAAKLRVPENYQPFTVPEGLAIDEATHAEFSTLAQKLNLSQEQAQELIDYHSKHWIGAIAEYEQRLARELADWDHQSRNHPEVGGAKFEESLDHARRFVERFGGQELRDALNKTRVGSHPVVFAALAKAGRLLAEDRFIPGGGAGVDDDSPEATARRVYRNVSM